MIKLSICMPTYNFGAFIGETLDSIILQLTDETELIIVDGASTDNTSEIVSKYQAQCPHIHYHRLGERGGIDRDMMLSVELASGEYCWLFSSDDIMKEKAISQMLLQTREQWDVSICGFDLCTLNIHEFLYKYPISSIQNDAVFNLSDPQEREAYFKAAIMTPAFFSFMSSILVKRSRWMGIPLEEEFIGSAWAHVVRLFRLIPSGLKVKYLAGSYLKKRSFNDSFMDKGLVHRLGMAIDGYNTIASAIFGKSSQEAFHLRRTLRNEIAFKQLIIAHASAASREEKKRLLQLVGKHYSDLPFFRFFALSLLKICSPSFCKFSIDAYHSLRGK